MPDLDQRAKAVGLKPHQLGCLERLLALEERFGLRHPHSLARGPIPADLAMKGLTQVMMNKGRGGNLYGLTEDGRATVARAAAATASRS